MKLLYPVCLLSLTLQAPCAAAGPVKPDLSPVCAAAGAGVPGRPGIKRVVVIGGPEQLPDPAVLKASLSGVEVINCVLKPGGQGVEGAFREALGYRPDLAVVLGAGPAEPPAPEGFYLRARKAAYRLLKKMRIRRQAPAVDVLAEKAGRLRALAAIARAEKVPLLLCALPVNLSGQPPAYYLPPENEDFAAGLLALGPDPARAAERFTRVLKKAPGNPLVEFYLAKALEAGGRFSEARSHYSLALDLDLLQERPSPRLNSIMKKSAADSGAGFCDLEGAFSRASANGLPGFEQFSYGARWRPAYNGLVWGEIAGAARTAGLAWFDYKAPPAPPALTDKDLRDTLAAAAAELSAYPPGGPSVLSEPAVAAFGFAEALRKGLPARFINGGKDLSGAPAGLLRAHLAEAARRRGDGQLAAAQAKLALASEPFNPRFRLLKDLCLLGADRKKEAKGDLEQLFSVPAVRTMAVSAARSYGQLAPGSPDPAVPPEKELSSSKKLSDEAVAKLLKGESAASGRLLLEALKANPFNAEALITLCSLKYSDGELRTALAFCDGVPGAAASRYPDSGLVLAADSLRLKALIYARLGRQAAAAAALKAALAAAPQDWTSLASARAELRTAEGY